MKRIVTILLCIGIAAILYASEKVLPVPHTVSVLPHSGQMQYNINLYHLQDPDFDFTVNLTYTSDGFRPLVYSGIVGQNWSLDVGGCVTREVIGLPDDGKFYNGSIYEDGFFEYLRVHHNELAALHTDAEYEGFANLYAGEKDKSSDIYSFSVNGHSGRFMIGWDGQARCLSGDVVKVDLTNVATQQSNILSSNSLLSPLTLPESSQITLTMLDGYKYIFGGTIDYLEYGYTYTQGERTYFTQDPLPVISAWHLAKVIAPNGREMCFHYQSHRQNQYSYIENGVGAYHNEATLRLFNNIYTPFLSPNEDIDLQQYEEPGVWHIIAEQSIVKNVILESVTTSDNTFGIQLTYENDSNYVFTHTHPYLYFNMPVQLQVRQEKPFVETVRIYTGDYTLAEWNLDYQEMRLGERQTPRQYLKSCTTTGNIGYTFNYDFSNAETLSGVDTLSHMDMYGYRNTSSHYKFGVLQQARDILGGRTNFEYERTEFDSIRIFYYNGQSVMLPYGATLMNSVCITGIAVADHTGHICLRKEYDYGLKVIVPPQENNMRGGPTGSTNSYSTGVLNIDYAHLRDTTPHFLTMPYDLLGYIHTQPTGRNLLEYTKVKEKIYKEDATSPVCKEYYYNSTKDSTNSVDNVANMSKIYSCISQAPRRALLVQVKQYDTDYQLIQSTNYTYTPVITDRFTVNVTDFKCRIYHPQGLLAQQLDSVHESNGTYTTRTTYTYDAMSRLSREDTYIGDEHYFASSVYGDAFFASDTVHSDPIVHGLWMLFLQNHIKEPVETITGFVRNNTEYVTSGIINFPKRYVFPQNGGGGPVTPNDSVIMRTGGSQFSIDPYAAPYAVMELHLAEPAQGFVPIYKQGGVLVADSRYDTVTHISYTGKQRVYAVWQTGQPVRQFTWDGRFLNITAEEYGNQTVSYTWLPYVGMTSQTDARGITTWYRYNALGQLVEIYRKNGNKKEVLQVYEYHYPVIEQ